MKVLILIMGARNSLAERNIRRMKDTFIKDTLADTTLDNEYTFAYYDGKWDCEKIKDEDGLLHICTISDDDIHSTYEKTIFAFELCLEEYDFDILVRINISSYLNIRMLDKCLMSIDPKCIYANRILVVTSDPQNPNFLAPRGDFFMTGRDNIVGIVNNQEIDKNRILDHVDDVLIGCAFIKYVGDSSYVDRLKQINYGYLPEQKIPIGYEERNICYRVKTVPPYEKVSGYSWEDNKFRYADSFKMLRLHELIKDDVYKPFNISDVVVDDKTAGCIAVQYIQTNIASIKQYIKRLWGG